MHAHMYMSWALIVKNLPANSVNVRDGRSIPVSGRSPGVGNGNMLQYSCLENPMNRGAWQATVHSGRTHSLCPTSQRVGHD